MTVSSLRGELERRKGRLQQVESDLKGCRKELRHDERDLVKHLEAREVIKTVGLATQQQLECHFSDIVTSALQAVFPDPYNLSVKFIERRGKTECDLGFERDGVVIDPITASGGGAIDVAGFALRIAAWSMRYPKSRTTLILDEPMRYLSTDLQQKAGDMMHEISSRLGIQMIIVTHEEELISCADKVFEVRQKKGVSTVTEQRGFHDD